MEKGVMCSGGPLQRLFDENLAARATASKYNSDCQCFFHLQHPHRTARWPRRCSRAAPICRMHPRVRAVSAHCRARQGTVPHAIINPPPPTVGVQCRRPGFPTRRRSTSTLMRSLLAREKSIRASYAHFRRDVLRCGLVTSYVF